jgi:hypothetical protein
MCVTVYSLFTVCGHCPCIDEQKCETYSTYSNLKQKLLYCCNNEVRTVKFAFDWCPGCKKVLFEDFTTEDEKGKGKAKEKETYAFEPRNIDAIRRYWEYKFIIGSATAIEPTKRLRFLVNFDQDMAKDSQTWTSISTINRLLEMMELGRQFSLSQRAMDFGKLTVDEATLQRALYILRPSEIWLGPKKHDFAIASWDRFATLLHMARLGTIIWANGDDEIYERKPGVSLHWESPYAAGIWKVTRYGEAVARSTEALCITGVTWQKELKLRLEALVEALNHALQ